MKILFSESAEAHCRLLPFLCIQMYVFFIFWEMWTAIFFRVYNTAAQTDTGDTQLYLSALMSICFSHMLMSYTSPITYRTVQ